MTEGRRLTHVYLLWHVHELEDGEEDEKLIGVYSSPEVAERAKQRAALLPGLSELPEGFHVSRYAIDEDHWTDGYVTIFHG